MQIQQYKHWYYHRSNVTTSLVSEVLIPFFRRSFSNSFHCLSSIMLGYFNLFLPIVPNWNGPTSICSAKEMSYWYHTYFLLFCRRLCALLGITGNIFTSIPSWFFVIISGQKRHSVVGYFLQSSYCLLYHWQQYTPYFLMSTRYNWSISNCTKYHLACFDPAAMWLMKNILSFELSFSILGCLSALWSPHLILLGFLRVTNIASSCSWSSGLYWYFLPLLLDPPSLDSIEGSMSGHKSDTVSYAHLISLGAYW